MQWIQRVRGQKVNAVETSAVAASLLENGWTAHWTFKVLIPCFLKFLQHIHGFPAGMHYSSTQFYYLGWDCDVRTILCWSCWPYSACYNEVSIYSLLMLNSLNHAPFLPCKLSVDFLELKNYRIFPGSFSSYQSADSLSCDSVEAQKQAELRYPQELLNSVEAGASLPDHEIKLKKRYIATLLRNNKPSFRHVNRTRYVIENVTQSLIFLNSMSDSKKGTRLTYPRINFSVSADNFPISGFRWCQFPIHPWFSVFINKAQGQSIPELLGFDFISPWFSNGQFYVALSKPTNPRKGLYAPGAVLKPSGT